MKKFRSKAQMIVESVLVFAGELAILLALIYWTANVGAVQLEYMGTIDSRIIQESLSSFYSAAEISNSSFSASLAVPPSQHILEVGKKNGYYVWVHPKKEFELPSQGGPSARVVTLKKVTEIPFVHFEGQNKVEISTKQFDEKKTTIVSVNRNSAGNIKSEVEVK